MVRGAVVFVTIFLGTIPIFLLFLVFGLPILLLPEPARVALRGPQVACGRLWILLSTGVLRLAGVAPPHLEGDVRLEPLGQYLLLSNHRSWADILVLLQLFGPRMPFPRFLAKREMLWIPFIGVAIWMLDFPLLRRRRENEPAQRSRADREAVARGCRRLGSGPFTLVIFAEGTRFTPQKKARQQGPFAHLLAPRSGGMGVALEHLGSRLDAIVDVTIGYPGLEFTFWDYLCGRGDHVRARVELLPLPEELLSAAGEPRDSVIQEWLNERWRDKDRCLEGWLEADASGTV